MEDLRPNDCSGIHTDRERHADGDPLLIKDRFGESNDGGLYWAKKERLGTNQKIRSSIFLVESLIAKIPVSLDRR